MNNPLPEPLPAEAMTGSIEIRSMDDLSRLSAMLYKSGLFGDVSDVYKAGVKVLAGLEMGVGIFASMTGIHIIQGRPTLAANLMAAKVKAHPRYDYRVAQLDFDVCAIEFYQDSQSLGISSFTTQDAQLAGCFDGKNKHTWEKFKRNMLFARALSNGVRWYCPDVFLGAAVYTPEEMGAPVAEDGLELNHSQPSESTGDTEPCSTPSTP